MRLLTILFILFATAYLASSLDRDGTPLDGFLFYPVISAQFAMLGVVFGISDEFFPKRFSIVLFGAIGLCVVFLLRPHFNGWELLLSAARLILLGCVFTFIRHYQRLVFTGRDGSSHVAWRKLHLWHLFVFTSIVALFLAFIRFLKSYDGPSSDMFLLAVTVFVGVFAALIPLMAAIAAIGQRDPSAGIPFAVAILLLATCMGFFSYSQTDSMHTGLQWSLNSILEALTITGMLLALRLCGYHLTSFGSDSVPRRAEPSDPHGAAVAGGVAIENLLPPPGDP